MSGGAATNQRVVDYLHALLYPVRSTPWQACKLIHPARSSKEFNIWERKQISKIIGYSIWRNQDHQGVIIMKLRWALYLGLHSHLHVPSLLPL